MRSLKMWTGRVGAVGALAGVVLTGCTDGGPTGGFCTAPRSVAIQAAVLDSVTGAPLADSASGTVHNAGATDSLVRVGGSDSLMIGGSTLGSYSVTIDRPGYLTWTKTRIRVSETGQCGNVLPVQVQARLVPE